MPLTKAQQTIFDDTSRFRICAAGRRFGKTFLSMWEIARVARHPGKRVYYISPSYRMSKQILWDDLKDKLVSKRWVKKINESDLTVTLINGSTISLRSADNPDSMRGVSLDLAILDEAAYMSPETWTHVIRPTLSDRSGKALFISTPDGHNWFHQLWTDAHTLPDYSSFQYTTIQGGQITPEEVDAARRELDLKTFRQEYEATFETSGNNVYYAFDMANVKPYKQTVPRTLYVGIDFNVDPISSIIFAKTESGLHAIDEIILPNSNTEELSRAIMERYSANHIIAFPDPAGRQRRTSASGKTDIIILQDYGMVVKAPRAHPPVKDRINSVNRMLCDADGNRRLLVDPGCKRTIEMFQKFQYKSGTSLPDKNSGFDHVADACGYAVHGLFAIKRPGPEVAGPQVFTHM